MISKRMVTLAARSMYTNHSTLDKQERELYVLPSEIRVCRRPEHESPAKKHLPKDRSKRNDFFSHCEQGKRRAIFAVSEVKKEILD